MRNNNFFTSLLVFICFAMYVAIELKVPCKEAESQCERKASRLEAENDSLKQNNKVLEDKYRKLVLRTDSLQKKLSGTRQTIIQLKNKQHEKVNAIDTLTNDELYSFFAKFEAEGPGRE